MRLAPGSRRCEAGATFPQPPPMQRIDFDLDGDFVELNQLLKLVGLADSGGAGKQLVASGAVAVDGALESRKTAKIRAGQRVRVGDVEIRVRREPPR